MDANTPESGLTTTTAKPRGRPPKYNSEEERAAARRAQVRKAVKEHESNKRADQSSLKRALKEGKQRQERLIASLNELAQRIEAEGPPPGCGEMIRHLAWEAKTILGCMA